MFTQGNQLWKIVQNMGAPRIFDNPVELWTQACEYFNWCDTHPWERAELVKHKGDAYEETVSIGRPYTASALCAFLGVSGSYFRTAKSELKAKVEKKKATANEVLLLATIERIDMIIQSQQLEGAAVGAFSATLITRLQGLADNVNNNNTGDATIHISVRDDKTAQVLNDLEDVL